MEEDKTLVVWKSTALISLIYSDVLFKIAFQDMLNKSLKQSNFLNKYNNYRLNMDLLFSVKGPTHYYYDLHLMSSLGLAMNDTLDYKQSLGRSENDTFPVPITVKMIKPAFKWLLLSYKG